MHPQGMKHRLGPMLLALAVAACGAGEPASASVGATDAGPDAALPVQAADNAMTPPPATPAGEPLALSDIDAYVAGMRRELELLQAGSDELRQARAGGDDAAEASALLELAMGDTETPGAQAAGVDVARYRAIKSRIDRIVGAVAARQQLRAMRGDPASMTPEQLAAQEQSRAEMLAQVGDPYAGLPADVVAALQARHDELAQLGTRAIGIRMNPGG